LLNETSGRREDRAAASACDPGDMAMQQGPDRVNLLIAHAADSFWPADLADSLTAWPVDLHWSRTDVEAIDLAATRGMHVAVVDDGLPAAGGLDLLRRIRRLGLVLPCLLVCDQADQRLLRDALALNVFSVLQAEAAAQQLAPMVLKVVRQVYQIDWHADDGMN
jgi:DNA-binding NarL/FixJ family response regulator